jgi:hypothetical protein
LIENLEKIKESEYQGAGRQENGYQEMIERVVLPEAMNAIVSVSCDEAGSQMKTFWDLRCAMRGRNSKIWLTIAGDFSIRGRN